VESKAFEYTIPVYWEVAAEIKVEATSLDDAIRQAHEADLPSDGEYVDGSFSINHECAEELNRGVEECRRIEQTSPKDLPLIIGEVNTDAGKAYLAKKLKGAK
jgi:hypothetical protein